MSGFDDLFTMDDFIISDENENELEESWDTGQEVDIFTTGQNPDIFTTKD